MRFPLAINHSLVINNSLLNLFVLSHSLWHSASALLYIQLAYSHHRYKSSAWFVYPTLSIPRWNKDPLSWIIYCKQSLQSQVFGRGTLKIKYWSFTVLWCVIFPAAAGGTLQDSRRRVEDWGTRPSISLFTILFSFPQSGKRGLLKKSAEASDGS